MEREPYGIEETSRALQVAEAADLRRRIALEQSRILCEERSELRARAVLLAVAASAVVLGLTLNGHAPTRVWLAMGALFATLLGLLAWSWRRAGVRMARRLAASPWERALAGATPVREIVVRARSLVAVADAAHEGDSLLLFEIPGNAWLWLVADDAIRTALALARAEVRLAFLAETHELVGVEVDGGAIPRRGEGESGLVWQPPFAYPRRGSGTVPEAELPPRIRALAAGQRQ